MPGCREKEAFGGSAMPGHEGKIETRCPACDAKYHVPASTAGHRVRCVKCQTTFRVAEQAKKQALVDRHSPPTEEDILGWLNDGSDDEFLAPRPRVVSGNGEVMQTDAQGPMPDDDPPTSSVEERIPRPNTVLDSAPISTGKGLRKTG
jgi:predicted Zn finger-like uncharacterized protein